MNQDRKQRAKDISVMSVMSRAGYKPVRETNSRAQFLSPFRAENNPSLVVNKVKNTWKDWGDADLHGDSIDLMMKLDGCEFTDALTKLLNDEHTLSRHVPVKEEDIEPHGLDILANNDITNPYLIEYGKSRGISPDLLSLYCREITFCFRKTPNFIHHALGFENDRGGFELRNEKHKIGNSPKTWRTVKSVGNKQSCDVFEGFFDFLSHLQLNGWNAPVHDSYILNSLVYCPFVVPIVNSRRSVNLYFDNDVAAKRYIKDYFQGRQYHIMGQLVYPNHEDYNEFVKHKLLNNG